MTTPIQPPVRERNPHDKLERLVAAATEVFGSEGYTRAQIAAICRVAGVSVGTFYDNFENKAELLLHIAEAAHETSWPPPTSSLEELEAQMCALMSSPKRGLSVAWLEAIRIEPELLAAHERFRLANLERYASWVRETRANWMVTSALDDVTTARAVVALLKEGFAATPEPLAERARFLARSIWALVIPSRHKTESEFTFDGDV